MTERPSPEVLALAGQLVDGWLQEAELEDVQRAVGWLVVIIDPDSGKRWHHGPVADILDAHEIAEKKLAALNEGIGTWKPFEAEVVPMLPLDDA